MNRWNMELKTHVKYCKEKVCNGRYYHTHEKPPKVKPLSKKAIADIVKIAEETNILKKKLGIL